MTRVRLALFAEAASRPILAVAAAAAALLTLVVDVDATVRGLLVFAFLLAAPGLALLAPLRPLEPAAELALVVAVSLALEAVVATAMLYAGMWAPEAILVVIGVITAGAAMPQLIRSAWRSGREEPS